MSNEWQRFEEVADHVPGGHRLFRSSAPNYDEYAPRPKDKTQKLTKEAVAFLIDQTYAIDSIISFNEFPYTAAEKALLADAKIDYLHLPVGDFQPQTRKQLKEAKKFFLEHKSTLVHCGYGHGRTGTGVTALQLYFTKGRYPPENKWGPDNHVETEEQKKLLRRLRSTLRDLLFFFLCF